MLKHILILSLSFLLFNAYAQDLHQPADMTAEQLNAQSVSTGGQISTRTGFLQNNQ